MPGLQAIASKAISAILSFSTNYDRSSVSGRPALTSLADQMPSQCCPWGPRLHLPRHHFLYGHSQLSKQQTCRKVCHTCITAAAKSVSTGKVAAVQAEFAQAGISAEATLKVLKQYKPVLNWDIETKLRPNLRLWLEKLGTEQLSEQLERLPPLLKGKPEECNVVFLWLSAMGIDADKVQRMAPQVILRKLNAMQ